MAKKIKDPEIETTEKDVTPIEVKAEEPAKVPQAPSAAPIAMVNGAVAPKDNAELMRHIAAMKHGGFVPDRFKNNYEVYAAVCYVRSLGFPDTAIRQCAVIKGVPSIFGDLPLSLVQRTKELVHFREFMIDESYNEICIKNKNLKAPLFATVCEIQRQGYPREEFCYTVDDALIAGQIKDIDKLKGDDLWKYQQTPWHKHLKKMMRYKARILALQSQFADALNGVNIGEDFGAPLTDTMKDVSPNGIEITDKANDLNNL